MALQARDFAARGWLAVVVIRRGYGSSDGLPGVSRGAAFMECGSDQLARGFDVEADDLEGALNVITARPDADPSRVLLFAQSYGAPPRWHSPRGSPRAWSALSTSRVACAAWAAPGMSWSTR